MRRSGGGAARQQSSGRSTSCFREIDWVADERGELQRPSKNRKDLEQKKTAHKTGDSLKRKRWSREENDNLIRMVNLHGLKRWSTVARGITGRGAHHCRDRWTFYLDPAVNNQPWSEQEDIELIQAYKIHGNKWSKLAKLFPGRTGKAVKNHWPSLMKKQMKSDLVRGFGEQFPYMPNDPLVTKNKGSSAIKSDQDSLTNNHVSLNSQVTVRSKSEQRLAENVSNESTPKGIVYDSTHGKESVSYSINVAEKADEQIVRSHSLSSVDPKCSSTSASFPGPLPKDESTNFLEVTPNRRFSPACINDSFDHIYSSAEPVPEEGLVSNIADLLDMSYCESLMIVPYDSPNQENSKDGM
ncbi:unnamed protein product [Urochloa humidicola]